MMAVLTEQERQQIIAARGEQRGGALIEDIESGRYSAEKVFTRDLGISYRGVGAVDTRQPLTYGNPSPEASRAAAQPREESVNIPILGANQTTVIKEGQIESITYDNAAGSVPERVQRSPQNYFSTPPVGVTRTPQVAQEEYEQLNLVAAREEQFPYSRQGEEFLSGVGGQTGIIGAVLPQARPAESFIGRNIGAGVGQTFDFAVEAGKASAAQQKAFYFGDKTASQEAIVRSQRVALPIALIGATVIAPPVGVAAGAGFAGIQVFEGYEKGGFKGAAASGFQVVGQAAPFALAGGAIGRRGVKTRAVEPLKIGERDLAQESFYGIEQKGFSETGKPIISEKTSRVAEVFLSPEGAEPITGVSLSKEFSRGKIFEREPVFSQEDLMRPLSKKFILGEDYTPQKSLSQQAAEKASAPRSGERLNEAFRGEPYTFELAAQKEAGGLVKPKPLPKLDYEGAGALFPQETKTSQRFFKYKGEIKGFDVNNPFEKESYGSFKRFAAAQKPVVLEPSSKRTTGVKFETPFVPKKYKTPLQEKPEPKGEGGGKILQTTTGEQITQPKQITTAKPARSTRGSITETISKMKPQKSTSGTKTESSFKPLSVFEVKQETSAAQKTAQSQIAKQIFKPIAEQKVTQKPKVTTKTISRPKQEFQSTQIFFQKPRTITDQLVDSKTRTSDGWKLITFEPKPRIPFGGGGGGGGFFPPRGRIRFPEGGESGFKRAFGGQKAFKPTGRYAPSLIGVFSGLKVRSAPKTLSGLEVRFPVAPFARGKRK